MVAEDYIHRIAVPDARAPTGRLSPLPSPSTMFHNRRGKRAAANLKVEFTLRYRNGESRAPLKKPGNLIYKRAVEFIHRDSGQPIDFGRSKLGKHFLNVAVG